MKNMYKHAGIIFMMVLIGLLTMSCGNVLMDPGSKGDSSPINAGQGRVSIDLGSGARTIMPSEFDLPSLYFVLSFTKGEDVESVNQWGNNLVQQELPVGTWALDIKAYTSIDDASDPNLAVASYTNPSVVIANGNNTEIDAVLTSEVNKMTQNGMGKLSYDINIPAGTTGMLLVTSPDTFPEGVLEELPLNQTNTTGSFDLDSGEYVIYAFYTRGGEIEREYFKIAHIYDAAVTHAVGTSDEFTDIYVRPPLDSGMDVTISIADFDMTDSGDNTIEYTGDVVWDISKDNYINFNTQMTALSWRIGSNSVGAGNSLCLNANNYPAGEYTLSLIFYLGEKLWQGEITFTVIEGIEPNNDAGDFAGNWNSTISTEFGPIPVSVTIIDGIGWALTVPADPSMNDDGEFNREGNIITLYNSDLDILGTVTLNSNGTATAVLNDTTDFPGTYTFTKGSGSVDPGDPTVTTLSGNRYIAHIDHMGGLDISVEFEDSYWYSYMDGDEVSFGSYTISNGIASCRIDWSVEGSPFTQGDTLSLTILDGGNELSGNLPVLGPVTYTLFAGPGADANKLTINGLSGRSGVVFAIVSSSPDETGTGGEGMGIISNDSVTIPLADFDIGGSWKGSGPHYIQLMFEEDDSMWVYTEGEPVDLEDLMLGNLPQYHITSTNNINFVDFYDITDIVPDIPGGGGGGDTDGYQITINEINFDFDGHDFDIWLYNDIMSAISGDSAIAGNADGDSVEDGSITFALYDESGNGFTTSGPYVIILEDYDTGIYYAYTNGQSIEQLGEDPTRVPTVQISGNMNFTFDQFIDVTSFAGGGNAPAPFSINRQRAK
jgi:hypothetical protein